MACGDPRFESQVLTKQVTGETAIGGVRVRGEGVEVRFRGHVCDRATNKKESALLAVLEQFVPHAAVDEAGPPLR